MMIRSSRFAAVTVLSALVAASVGCSSEKKEPDCVVDPNAKPKVIEQKVERFGLGKVGSEKLVDHDWCRACVMSKVGFASCQKVYSDEPGVQPDREPLRAKARQKACADAGYPKDACPDAAVISVMCKDDPPPEGTKPPGQAVQDLFQSLNPPGEAAASPPVVE